MKPIETFWTIQTHHRTTSHTVQIKHRPHTLNDASGIMILSIICIYPINIFIQHMYYSKTCNHPRHLFNDLSLWNILQTREITIMIDPPSHINSLSSYIVSPFKWIHNITFISAKLTLNDTPLVGKFRGKCLEVWKKGTRLSLHDNHGLVLLL